MVLLRHDYSWSEHALGFWCPLMLLMLSVTSLGLRYVTSPAVCFTPAHFTYAHITYVQEMCFQKTYQYSGMQESIPDASLRPQPYFTFHQWVPFALGVAAIVCLVPHVLWRKLSAFLWLDTHALAQALCDSQRQNASGRHTMLRDSALVLQAGLNGGSWVLSVATLLRKLLSLSVCVALAVLAVGVFRPGITAGDTNLAGSARGWLFNVSEPLPYSFTCELPIRSMKNVHKYVLSCALPLSLVYSKGFTYLFYLFLLLALCCLLDVLTSLCRLVIPGLKDLALHRYLAVSGSSQDPQVGPLTSRFLDSLGLDGHLVLAVTADACGPLAAADLTNHMFLAYKGESRPGPAPATSVSAGHAPATVGPAPLYPSARIGGTAPVVDGARAGNADAMPLLPMSGQGAGSCPSKPQ